MGFTSQCVATARTEKANADGEPLVTHARFVASGTALRLLHSPIAIACPAA